MIEIAKGLFASSKLSGFTLLFFSLTRKVAPNPSLMLDKDDFSDDEVPGDNFPYIVMHRHIDAK